MHLDSRGSKAGAHPLSHFSRQWYSPRMYATRLFFPLALLLLAAGCPGSSPGSGADLAGTSPADLSVAPDLSGADLAGLDARGAADGPGVVVCNLGNDPLPCSEDTICTPNGATCDKGRRYCVCITPNCTPGDDKTCNDNPAIDSLHGTCVSSGSCRCLSGFMKSDKTGKCL